MTVTDPYEQAVEQAVKSSKSVFLFSGLFLCRLVVPGNCQRPRKREFCRNPPPEEMERVQLNTPPENQSLFINIADGWYLEFWMKLYLDIHIGYSPSYVLTRQRQTDVSSILAISEHRKYDFFFLGTEIIVKLINIFQWKYWSMRSFMSSSNYEISVVDNTEFSHHFFFGVQYRISVRNSSLTHWGRVTHIRVRKLDQHCFT